MKTYKYTQKNLVGDYLRSSLGFLILFFPYLYFDLTGFLQAVLICLMSVFFVFGFITLKKHISRIVVDDETITVEAFQKTTLSIQSIKSLKLKYFSTKRSRQDGWMQLKISGKGKSLSFDSHMDNFQEFVEDIIEKTENIHLKLNDTTLSNLLALGITMPDKYYERKL